MMQLLLIASLLAQPAVQDPEQRVSELPLDRVVFIVNEDIVTLRGNQRMLQAAFQAAPPQNEEERRRANILLQQRQLEQFIGQQAGETLGYDPNFIERFVRDYEERFIERIGGIDAMSQYMADRKMTLADLRQELRINVYRDLWEESVTGQGVAAKSRLTVDRWVRPGMLKLQHDLALATPGGAEALGGTPARVSLQILELDAARVGGPSAAPDAAKNLLERLKKGEDFEELGRQFAVDGTRLSAREPLEEQAIESVDPVLGKAVRAAGVGAWLPPIAPSTPGGRWRIVRLVSREAAKLPPFGDRQLQVRLRDSIRGNLDLQRLSRARAEQYLNSYIWPKLPEQQNAPRQGR